MEYPLRNPEIDGIISWLRSVISLKLMLRCLKDYIKESILGPLFKMLEASFELLIPLVVAAIVDTGIGNSDQGYIVKTCLVMIALGIVGLLCSVTAQFFAARAAVGVAAKLRHRVMAHVLGLSYSDLDGIGTSTIITRLTSDINQVQTCVNLTLRLLLRSPFVVFGAMIMAFTIDVRSALIFAAVIPVLCLLVFGIMFATMPLHKKVQAALDRVTATTRQNLAGVRVLRAFCMETMQKEEFNHDIRDLTQKQIFAGRISNFMNPITFVVVNLAVIVLVRIGALQVEGGILTQGLVIALYNYMSQILVELIKMANLMITIPKAAACANRVESLLNQSSTCSQGTTVAKVRGAVEFKNVTAKYRTSPEPSLEDITFRAEPGQTIGIIGGTGSGKTTLINLIPGLYPTHSGEVLLDGIHVTAFDPQALRQQIAIVPQKSVLFKGTIRDNLLWGNENATEDDLWKALEIAQARDVVLEKENGLDAAVEQGGTNFSGGQRQRLCIARALVRKPAILILDDSASALDYATDAKLRLAISSMTPAPTTFIVSQRASAVRHADLILVLDDGKPVGQGSHDALLESCEVYQEIYYSQFPREVSANG